MSDIAIRVDNLSKQYRIGKRKPYKTVRESVQSLFRSPLARIRADAADQTFWALKDVNFEVKQGEVVGIIGRNGAGKSTLLKVLSRITDPTSGQVETVGRVGSLLEVGTGFHGELTGRENVFLNGAILGMKKAEIARKFDEIIAFAEIDKFLDTPVKHYSSGMYVRLAFAVAAHLEPEILIVDEVLAVGDVAFQKKCMGRMGEVAQAGRTVLFVSHNMQAMARLCTRCVVLDEGRVVGTGDATTMIAGYLNAGKHSAAERRWESPAHAPGGDVVRLSSIRACDSAGQAVEMFDIRHPVLLELGYDVSQSGHVLVPNINISNSEGLLLFAAVDNDPAWRKRPRPAGHYTSIATIPGNLLTEGTFNISVAVSTFNPLTVHASENDVVSFQVFDPLQGDSARGDYTLAMPGVVRPLLHWTTNGGNGDERQGGPL